MIGIKFVSLEDKLNDTQTWMNLSFSLANLLVEIEDKNKEHSIEEREEIAVKLMGDILYKNVSDPIVEMMIDSRFKKASKRFFKDIEGKEDE